MMVTVFTTTSLVVMGRVAAEPTTRFMVTHRHEGERETLIDFVWEKRIRLGLVKFLLVTPVI